MIVNSAGLSRHLADGMENRYFVFGKELFLIENCRRYIREKARELGYTEQIPLTVTEEFDWNSLSYHLDNQSLFADKKLIELRFLDAVKPGRQGAGALTECLKNRDDTAIVMVVGGEIEPASRRSKWFQAWEADAVVVENRPLTSEQYRAWIKNSLTRKNIDHDPQVADRLAYYFEGNMLAAANEIRKMALGYAGNKITVDEIQRIVSDQGRFNVYLLTDAYLSGDLDRSVRMLNGLKREGTSPNYILWALLRELRLVYQVSFLNSKRISTQSLFTKNRVWKSRAQLIGQASRRLGLSKSADVLSKLAKIDRIIKGRESGYSGNAFWDELENLALDLQG